MISRKIPFLLALLLIAPVLSFSETIIFQELNFKVDVPDSNEWNVQNLKDTENYLEIIEQNQGAKVLRASDGNRILIAAFMRSDERNLTDTSKEGFFHGYMESKSDLGRTIIESHTFDDHAVMIYSGMNEGAKFNTVEKIFFGNYIVLIVSGTMLDSTVDDVKSDDVINDFFSSVYMYRQLDNN